MTIAASRIGTRIGCLCLTLCAWHLAFLTSYSTVSADEPLYRTDGGDPKLPWFKLQPGEFPPVGSARRLSGELIAVDHVNRQGVLRVDRGDDQSRPQWDRPLPFVLLPFGSVSFRGSPAELRDIPIGTHLHGEFYEGEPLPKYDHAYHATFGQSTRLSPYLAFNRVVNFEDDFSHSRRLGRSWRIESIDAAAGFLTVVGVGPDRQTDPKPTKFVIGPDTRVWKGRGFGTLDDLTSGQSVLLNLTVCTLKGPGRATDIWLDAESQSLASAQQLEVHRRHQREHGLAGWIDAVDNKLGTISVTLFGGVDPKLYDDFPQTDTFTAAVAEDSLRTYDQINDRKAGPGTTLKSTPTGVGHGGLRVTLRPSELLEGFRPKRIVRIWPSAWKVDDLPFEEQLFPR